MLFPFGVRAQDAAMVVSVEHTGSDLIGEQLVFQIREKIRESTSMCLSRPDEPSFIVLSLITIDSDSDKTAYSTTYSATWLLDSASEPFAYYITSQVRYCGANRVEICAMSLVANTDKNIMQAIRDMVDQ
jgi:hypothetical protein